ncbi:MAG: protoglobin domain-containing protein, partial [Myxococcota bacterium]
MIRVSAPEVRARLGFLGLTEEDLGVISAWEKVCRNACDGLVDEFYDHILANPTTSAIVEKHTTVAKQRPLLTRYILTMFAGRVDDEYLEYRHRVGKRHDEIDLDSSWYVAMYGVIQRALTDAVRDAGASSAELGRFSQALQSLIRVDIALCMGALMDSRRDQLEEQQRLEREKAEQACLAINQLIEEVRNGKLDARGDADAFDGGWRELVGGVNDLIDAFVAPINVTAEYVDRISKGD